MSWILFLMIYNWPVFRCPSLAGFGCPPRRQGDSKVFKKYSQMKREALAKLDRGTSERHLIAHSVTVAVDRQYSAMVLLRSEPKKEVLPEDAAPKPCKIKESA